MAAGKTDKAGNGKLISPALPAPTAHNRSSPHQPGTAPMDRFFATLGSISALIAVAAGAFGAHALRARLSPDLLAVFETGARYQMYHALGLLGVAWIASRSPSPFALWAGWLFVAGTVLFSGSLYALALSGIRSFGAITPLGGVAFMAGWVCLALAARRR
jgi:uncharacterized membrane protein YgdD (TMEM256/DUF423 family)